MADAGIQSCHEAICERPAAEAITPRYNPVLAQGPLTFAAPVDAASAAALLAALDSMKDWEPITEEFPDVDAGLLPLDDIDFGEEDK